MINKISSWASGLIVAVIIGTIIEMILPDNKNKKYVKVVIGLFIMYTIIAPVIGELDNINIDFDTMITEYAKNTVNQSVEASTNITFEQTYKENIENDIVSNLKEKGYIVSKIEAKINFTEEDYGTISSINLILKEEKSEISIVENVEISIGNENTDKVHSNEKSNEIKKFLNDNYGVPINNIYISFI